MPQIHGRSQPFRHMERNRLTKVGEPTPNPLVRGRCSAHGRQLRELKRIDSHTGEDARMGARFAIDAATSSGGGPSLRHGLRARMAWQIGGLALLSALTANAGLAAETATSAPPGRAADTAATRKTLVLLQLVLNVDGKPRDALGSLRLYAAPLDGQEPPRRLAPKALPSADATAQGWATLEFAPGSHFLLVLPAGMGQTPPTVAYHVPSARFGRLVHHDAEAARAATWHAPLEAFVFTGAAPDHFEIVGGYLLQVPQGLPSLYAGTFSVACSNGEGKQHDLLRVCSDVSVSDRHAEAPALPATADAAATVPPPALVSRYGTTLVAVDPRGDGLLTTEVHKTSKLLASEVTATPANMPFYVIGTSPAGALLNLFSLASKAMTDAQRTRVATEQNAKWHACLEQMAAETAAEGFEDAVRKGADQALDDAVQAERSRGPVPPAGGGLDFNLVADLEPKLLQVAPCRGAGNYCLEIAMRVTLRDLRRQRLAFDAVYVRADAVPPGDPLQSAMRVMQLRADDRPAAATLEAWCGSDRAARFRAEVEAASASIVRTAMRRTMGQ